MRRPKDSRDWKHADKDKSYVDIDRVRFIFIEIAHRVGKAEAARRIGIGRHSIYMILKDTSKKFVERKTAQSAVAVLKELREKDIVYSKNSIRRGAVARGEQPTRPIRRKEFYKDPGRVEKETEQHRKARLKQKQEEERLQQLTGY
jgi:hypothetical protein